MIYLNPRSLTREFFKSFPVKKVRKMKSALSQNVTAGKTLNWPGQDTSLCPQE